MKKLFFIISFICLFVSQLYSTENSISNILDPNGRIMPGISGGFSTKGYSMTTDESGAPVFSPSIENAGSWSAPGPFINSSVSCIAIIGSTIYVGGQFDSAGGSPASYLMQWNGTSWTSVGGGVNSDVICMTVSGTDLYIGGFFSDAGGSGASKIAKWNGTAWSSLGGGINNGRVRAICVSGNTVYAGGEFTHIGDVFANYIAVWNGVYWDSLGHGVSGDVWDMALSGNDLYVGGLFTHAGNNIPVNYIARWNNGWHAIGTGLQGETPPSTAYCTAVTVSGNSVYFGGIFSFANGVAANNIVKWDGTNFSPLGSGLSFEATAICVAGNKIYAGGFFFYAGSDTVNRIAQWDGTTWSALGTGTDDGNVYALCQSGNDLYVGGSFIHVSGIQAWFLAKWHDDGINSTTLPITSGGGFIQFNTTTPTAASISIGSGAGSGIISVFFYQISPVDFHRGPNTSFAEDTLGVIGNISNYSWIIQQQGLAVPFTGKVRFKLSDIPANGITNPDSVIVYSRPTPGTGNFTALPTTYISGTGEIEADVTNFSEFVFGSTFNTLPVELSSFTSIVVDNNVNLKWSTMNELNNSHFEIHRLSKENNVWKNIGTVAGSGTANEMKNYSFTDKALNTGTYNYRLKQVDYNGNFEYYNLANEVIIGVPGKYSLKQNYPNPFNPVTKISYEIPQTGFVSLKVYDISGKLVLELVNENQNAGVYSVDFNAKNLASGTYIYRLKAVEFTDVKKMVLVK